MNSISSRPFLFRSTDHFKRGGSYRRQFTSIRDKPPFSKEVKMSFCIAELFKDNQVNFQYVSAQITNDLKTQFPFKVVKGNRVFYRPETENLQDWLIYYFTLKNNPSNEKVEFHYDRPEETHSGSS